MCMTCKLLASRLRTETCALRSDHLIMSWLQRVIRCRVSVLWACGHSLLGIFMQELGRGVQKLEALDHLAAKFQVWQPMLCDAGSGSAIRASDKGGPFSSCMVSVQVDYFKKRLQGKEAARFLGVLSRMGQGSTASTDAIFLDAMLVYSPVRNVVKHKLGPSRSCS
jgi:hypothetical protein